MAACLERLKFYLHENKVPFTVLPHREAFTAQNVAAAIHETGAHFAKVVIAWVDGRLIMLTLPAPAHVDFERVEQMLHAQYARVAREEEFKHLFKDCDVGAMPPFGHLYSVPVYLDRALTQAAEIIFNAGTHQDALKLALTDYLRLETPTIVDFIVHPVSA